MGDWNAKMFAPNCSNSQFVCELMAEMSLELIETGPSHHAPIKDSWIDIILTDGCDFVLEFDRKL